MVTLSSAREVSDGFKLPPVLSNKFSQLWDQDLWKTIERHRDKEHESTNENESTPPGSDPARVHWGQVQSLGVEGEKVNIILKHQCTQRKANDRTKHSKSINKSYKRKLKQELI